ncbi:MAG: hypothetical protein HUJ94_07385 [Bacteroidales bacterium]|nr:hypothetical protein [Bacteroidales bacterium]
MSVHMAKTSCTKCKVRRKCLELSKTTFLISMNETKFCPHCGKPTRIGHRVMEDGSKKRSCKLCKEVIYGGHKWQD